MAVILCEILSPRLPGLIIHTSLAGHLETLFFIKTKSDACYQPHLFQGHLLERPRYYTAYMKAKDVFHANLGC